jgi:hypothetical protein
MYFLGGRKDQAPDVGLGSYLLVDELTATTVL